MSTRLNDIANELANRADEVARVGLDDVADRLRECARQVRLADQDVDDTGVHRVEVVLKGDRDAVQRFVRRMLNAAGLDLTAFTITPTTD